MTLKAPKLRTRCTVTAFQALKQCDHRQMKFSPKTRMIEKTAEETIMLNRDTLNDMATKISEALPEPARKMQAQFKSQVEDMIAQGLKDLHVVTQDEFDRQAEKLSKAEAKLADLEARLATLEKTDS